MITFKRAVWSLLVALVVYVVGTGASRYCDISPEHTLCKYYGPGPACGPHLLATGVSPSDVAVILDTHNQLRSHLAQGLEQRGSPGPQPPAADMRVLQWDEELAAIAQMHALQCVFEHECNSCRRVDRWPVGQNLYISSANLFESGNDWSGIIEDWYSEVEGFDGTTVEDYKYAHTTGHFTQMTWATTTKIGCGFSMFQDENGWFEKLYTCNYGPVGNGIDAPMYNIGTPCSMCLNEGCSYDYPGLCLGESTGFVYPSVSIGNFQKQQLQEIQPVAATLRTLRPTSDIRNFLGTNGIYNPSSFSNSLKTVYSNPGIAFANSIKPSSSYQYQIQPALNGVTPIRKISAPYSFYSSKPIQTGGTHSFNVVNDPAFPRLVQQQNKFAKPIFKHRRRTPSGLRTRQFYGQPIGSKQVDNSASRRRQQGDSYDVLNNRPGTIDQSLLSTSKIFQDFGQYESNIAYPALLDGSLASPSSEAYVGFPHWRTQQKNVGLPAWNTQGNNNLVSLSPRLTNTNKLSRPTQYNNNYPPLFPQRINSDSSSRQSQNGNYLSTLSTPQKETNDVFWPTGDVNYLSTSTQQLGSSYPSGQPLDDDYLSALATQQEGSDDPSWQTLDDDYFSTLATQQQGSNNPSWQTLDDDYFSTLATQQEESNDPSWQTSDDEYFSTLATQQHGYDPFWQTSDDDYFSTLTTQQQGYNDPSRQTIDYDYLPSSLQQSDPSDPSWLSQDEEYITL